MGRRESGRPGADDGDLLAPAWLQPAAAECLEQGRQLVHVRGDLGDVGPRGLQHLLGRERLQAAALAGEPLQGPDGYGLVVSQVVAVGVHPRDGPPAAGGLARRTADAAADGGEGVGAPGDEVGLLEAALGDGPYVAPGVGADGAGVLAGDEAAVVALGGDIHLEQRVAGGRGINCGAHGYP